MPTTAGLADLAVHLITMPSLRPDLEAGHARLEGAAGA